MSADAHPANPADGAERRPLTLRPRSFDRGPVTVYLVKRRTYTEGYDDGDDVYLGEVYIGSVQGYTGSLDRKAGRLRIPGKQRRLWSYYTPDSRRGLFGQVSRADCIRDLIHWHERRNRR
jgi:hypothetical protein